MIGGTGVGNCSSPDCPASSSEAESLSLSVPELSSPEVASSEAPVLSVALCCELCCWESLGICSIPLSHPNAKHNASAIIKATTIFFINLPEEFVKVIRLIALRFVRRETAAGRSSYDIFLGQNHQRHRRRVILLFHNFFLLFYFPQPLSNEHKRKGKLYFSFFSGRRKVYFRLPRFFVSLLYSNNGRNPNRTLVAYPNREATLQEIAHGHFHNSKLTAFNAFHVNRTRTAVLNFYTYA